MVPEPARTATWRQLLAHPDVVEHAVSGGRVGLMAFHGGLEGGTLEIASAAAAGCGASLYTVHQPPALRWHVPSNTVDPAHAPALAEWLTHVDVAIALHGYGRIARPRQVLLGGTNRRLAALLAGHLQARLTGFAVISDLALIPAELRGVHPANPVNRPPGGGVQLELPPSARGTSPGSDGAPALVVDALVAGIREWESASDPAAPYPKRQGRAATLQSSRRAASLERHATGEVRHVTLSDVIDDQFLARYRALLDAEDAAFDELEHAFEDGNRAAFNNDLAAWRKAVEKKLNYLHRLGVVLPPTISA